MKTLNFQGLSVFLFIVIFLNEVNTQKTYTNTLEYKNKKNKNWNKVTNYEKKNNEEGKHYNKGNEFFI